MRSKERVLTAFACQEPDRVPINYFANAGIDQRLKRHYGLAPEDSEKLLHKLGVDFRGVAVPYAGPKLHPDIPERGVKVDQPLHSVLWGPGANLAADQTTAAGASPGAS